VLELVVNPILTHIPILNAWPNALQNMFLKDVTVQLLTCMVSNQVKMKQYLKPTMQLC
jgi:hypothetical protein